MESKNELLVADLGDVNQKLVCIEFPGGYSTYVPNMLVHYTSTIGISPVFMCRCG